MPPNLNHEQKTLQILLRQVRKESGLSQQELAVSLEKPQSFVSKYESGERRLDVIELRQVCQQIGIEFVVFIERLEKALAIEDEGKSKISQSG
ncbi:MAG: helix-turn-helix transcriptional regulator [Anaerolineaceae bacterium]|nr:helix-turn-helix transcriptional regulator [Anaerolineaceae bacterium]